MAGELAKKLSLLCNLEESEDLMFAADVALEYADNISVLDLLKDNYTLTSVSECHEKYVNYHGKNFSQQIMITL